MTNPTNRHSRHGKPECFGRSAHGSACSCFLCTTAWLRAERKKVQVATQRQLAREAEGATYYNEFYREGIDAYVGMAADYAEIDESIMREALHRAAASDVDCDDWEEELRGRRKRPDTSSFWVLQMNVTDGIWQP